MIGQIFGELIVTKTLGKDRRGSGLLECLCSCGRTKTFLAYNLKSGHTKSCGCASTKRLVALNTKHGLHGTREHNIWASMRQRCNDKNHKYWHRYGGRGITVCARWDSFDNFLIDMGRCPSGKQLDRRDNNKGYSPENCRWVTAKEQQNNRSDTVWLEHNGKKQPLTTWAKELNLSPSLLRARMYRGWRVPKLFQPPKHATQPGLLEDSDGRQ